MLAGFYLIANQVCSQWRAAEREVHPEGHTMSTASGQVSVREIVALLRRWQVRLLAGESGLARPVSWAATMRARLPAFEGFAGGELALLTLGTLRVLRAQVMELTLPIVVEQLAEIGVSAIAIGGLGEEHALAAEDASALAEAQARAERLALPLLALPAAHLAEVENEVIAHIMARREQLPTPSEAPDAYAARVRASLRSEALDALLTGTYAGEAAMRVRAAQLGYDLTQ
ncbi:MAG TPA: PucR family transcriptional regulator ligand-binding domain-containing protein, partial [Ktedonobacterales bacterium]|nr:PucR family transcriptional regulator ligand-binding domain-containing protein [Ktedonobacterales bacterium]